MNVRTSFRRLGALRELALATEIGPDDPGVLFSHAATLLNGGEMERTTTRSTRLLA